jgi:hypothetical protein
MLKTALLVALAVCIAVAGGGASVWYVLDSRETVGAVTVGGWTTYPDLGTPNADPYMAARLSREGLLVLGRAEGVAFTADRDSSGEPLRLECAYTMEGTTPPARLWTLHAADSDLRPVPAAFGRAGALHSQALLRRSDNSVQMTVSPVPAPGNWLATAGTGPMSLVLVLYDTSVSGQVGLADVALPQILKGDCGE